MGVAGRGPIGLRLSALDLESLLDKVSARVDES